MPDLVRVDSSELVHAIYQYQGRARNLRRVLPAVGDALVAVVSDVYEAEGPDWEPLTDATKSQRRGSTEKILQDTGVMKDSTERAVGADWVEALGGAAYTDFHATGTRFMPKRNPFDLGPFEEDFLEDAADMFADEVVR